MRALDSVARRSWILVACALALGGCGGDDQPPPTDGGPQPTVDAAPPVDSGPVEIDAGPELAPLFRNPVATPDAELASAALRILGASAVGGSESCSSCHGITREKIREWRALSDITYANCLDDLEVTTEAAADEIVACLRGGDGTTPFAASHAGVFSTAAQLEWFPFVFRRALGTSWAASYGDFVARAAMPTDGRTPLTQEEFDIVAEWFIRGVPMLDETLPDEPVPTGCTPSVSPALVAHVDEMIVSGWTARNEDTGILMYGCSGATSPLECLASEPLASTTTFGATWNVIPGSKMRVLHTTDYRSSFWTRSSADGRFVGHGGGSSAGANMIDLQGDRYIAIDAQYDPGFFPDNSGFMFLGGGGVCEQSVLTSGAHTRIDFDEAGCQRTSVGLYEHLGASLDGGDYWAVNGQFTSDNGGHSVTRRDPSADFSMDSDTTLTRMRNSGSGFTTADTFDMPTPFEGDAVISPSSHMMVSRVAGDDRAQLGFVMRQIVVTDAGGSMTVTTPQIARYCLNGGKPGFSYDERWMAVHHYIGGTDDQDAIDLGFTGADDPAYAGYRTNGAANVFLVDLRTGERIRVTNMSPGQYAVFPHFRSDGWLYFLVRNSSTDGEHVVASDAALVLAGR